MQELEDQMRNVQTSLDNMAQLLHKALPAPPTQPETQPHSLPERPASMAAYRHVPPNTGPVAAAPGNTAQPVISLAQWVQQIAGPETHVPSSKAPAPMQPESNLTHILPSSPTTSFGQIHDIGSGSQLGPRASTSPFVPDRSPRSETRPTRNESFGAAPKLIEAQSRVTLAEDEGEGEIGEEGMSTIRDMLRDEEVARLRADGHDRTGHIERDVFRGEKGLGKSHGHDQTVLQRGDMQGSVMDAVDIGLCGEIEGKELFDLYVAPVRYSSS